MSALTSRTKQHLTSIQPHWIAAMLLIFTSAALCQSNEIDDAVSAQTHTDSDPAKATFAGGCFWCMEKPFEKLEGVESVVSGFSGGEAVDPTYDEVSSGQTNHTESVQIAFDPKKISYRRLLEVYWRQIDPTDPNGQFADQGSQYRPVIFYHTPQQKHLAKWSKRNFIRTSPFEESIVVPIEAFNSFYAAKEYHQDFYKKNAKRYKQYYKKSGRGPFLKKHWDDNPVIEAYNNFNKPSESKLREQLTDIQYRVTQQDGTEQPFANKHTKNKQPGIYVDILSGEPLFSSTDKFDSGTGWPSFTRPLEPALIVERPDQLGNSFAYEVRSRFADSHLGHIILDGPPPTNIRYCMNSAAMRYIPKDQLKQKGYGRYEKLFQE